MPVAITVFGIGCNISDAGMSAYLPPDKFFAEFSLEHKAINLSTTTPYDTITLRTIRLMGDDRDVPGDVTYSVSSPSISISNGVLKAESAVDRAVVRVKLTHGKITRTDSAYVSVSATTPEHLRDFGLRLPVGDSAKISSGEPMKTISLIRESESGTNMPNLIVHMVSSDSSIARITQSDNSLNITPVRPGRVVLYGSTFAFGTAWRDSLVFTVGWPIRFNIPISEKVLDGLGTTALDFAYKDVTIGVGGCILWTNESLKTDIDVQFDSPSDVFPPSVGSTCQQLVPDPSIGGNIAPWRGIPFDPNNALASFQSIFRARTFSTPGVFRYQSTINGKKGIVRVCDEHNDTTCAPLRIGGWQ